jgi:hypothetical protein
MATTINQNGVTQYTDDSGIQFTNIDLANGTIKSTGAGKWTGANSMFLPDNAEGGTITGRDTRKFINAVDIDWNSAEITSTAFPSMDRTINTTGDLLSWIKEGIEEAAVSGRTSEVVRRSL